MSSSKTLPLSAALALSTLALAGCSNLRQVTDPARFYVLSAMPAGMQTDSRSDLAVGLGRVEVPAYLLDTRIATRRRSHQIDYSEYHRWAERLDKGMQRVVGANLSLLLSSDRVMLSTWQRGEVSAEIYLAVQRFEPDERGRIILEASWRITSPGGEASWGAGHCQLTRQGPVFQNDPEGAVGELSQALADLSGQIAATVRNVSTRPGVPKAERSP